MTMDIPAAVPPEKRECLRAAVGALSALEGVGAVALGGSYARGTQHAGSDLDLGIYYSEAAPFAIDGIRRVALDLSNGTPPVVTDFYQWGPWVNGGAWVLTPAGKLDFLYRSTEHVERTIEEAWQGIHQHHYGQQPTFGFYSVIYLAETHACVPLFDPQATLLRLKEKVALYPPKLKQAIVAHALWGAEFTFAFAHQYAAAGDVYNTVGCLVRITGYLTQALYALNERYFTGDKGAMEAIGGFARCPPEYGERVSHLLAHPGTAPEELATAVKGLEGLWQEVVHLTEDAYTPGYPLP
jgi:hypothetical protein